MENTNPTTSRLVAARPAATTLHLLLGCLPLGFAVQADLKAGVTLLRSGEGSPLGVRKQQGSSWSPCGRYLGDPGTRAEPCVPGSSKPPVRDASSTLALSSPGGAVPRLRLPPSSALCKSLTEPGKDVWGAPTTKGSVTTGLPDKVGPVNVPRWAQGTRKLRGRKGKTASESPT